MRDEHSFLASEIFSLPYLQSPAAVRFGDSAVLSFGEVIKQLRLSGRESTLEKAPKEGQFLSFIRFSVLMVEWLGGCQLRHKPHQ